MLRDAAAKWFGPGPSQAKARAANSHDVEARLERGIRRMGTPSWWILDEVAVGSRDGMPAFEIVRAVEATLHGAGYPIHRLGAATAHHALERMEDDGFLKRSSREVDVPVGHGATRREQRPVWAITGLGAMARDRHRALEQAFSRKLSGGLAGV